MHNVDINAQGSYRGQALRAASAEGRGNIVHPPQVTKVDVKSTLKAAPIATFYKRHHFGDMRR